MNNLIPSGFKLNPPPPHNPPPPTHTPSQNPPPLGQNNVYGINKELKTYINKIIIIIILTVKNVTDEPIS